MNYPHSLDDSNSLFQVKDLGRSALFSEIDATQLEVMIENPTNFPEGRHIVVTDNEMMIVSHRVDSVLHIEKRGAFNTFPDVHSRASKIGVVFASAHYEALRDATIEIQKELWTYRKPVIDIINDPQTIIPVENDSYLVGTNPINEFVGKTNNIAIWNGIEWTFIAPQVGFETYVVNKGKYEFNGTSWVLNKDIEISNVNDLQNQLNNRYTKSENVKKQKIEELKIQLEKYIEEYVYDTPLSEKISWGKQEYEAREYLKDNNAPTPYIDALLASRNKGENKLDLINKIITKADDYSVFHGTLLGKLHTKLLEVNDFVFNVETISEDLERFSGIHLVLNESEE